MNIPQLLCRLAIIFAIYYFLVKKRLNHLIVLLLLNIISLLIYLIWLFIVKKTTIFNLPSRSIFFGLDFVYCGMLFSSICNFVSSFFMNKSWKGTKILIDYKLVVIASILSVVFFALYTMWGEILYGLR